MLLAAFLLFHDTAAAQQGDAITLAMNYKVRTAHIRGRWVPDMLKRQVEATMAVGGIYDPARLILAQKAIADELTNSEEFALQMAKGSTSVLYVTSRTTADTAARDVDIEFYPYYLRIDLVNVGDNVLPLPRIPTASFLRNVPNTLWVTTPVAGFYSDRHYGPSVYLHTQTDLLHLSQTGVSTSPYHLNIDLDGMRSVSHPYGSFHSAVALDKVVPTEKGMGWALKASFDHVDAPLGAGKYQFNKFNFNGALQGNSPIRCFSKFEIDAGVNMVDNKYTEGVGGSLNETSFNLGFAADKKFDAGLGRIGVYYDDHFPEKSAFMSYQRLGGQLAFAGALGKDHTNWDLETSLGAGSSWGLLPVYAGFWAGNSSRNFLYEPLSAVTGHSLLSGPLVRSLGQNEGGIAGPGGLLQGGTSYWNFSFSLSIPVPSWARALIPDIVITETPRRITLRSALKSSTNTAANAIYDDYVDNRGFPDNDSTDALVQAIVNKDIRPAINYLADRANIYSVKPVLLFDAAHLYTSSALQGNTWLGAGVGLQLTVVNAKFQIGYMQTISPASDKSKGNFLINLTLQNFY